jgi:hypothetical protein
VKRTVDFDNRAEVADWFAGIMDSAYDLAEIAGAALKPRDERILSKAELRRELDANFDELRQACRAGRRGIRAPRRGA